MKCPYCDSEFELDTLKEYEAVVKAEQPDSMEWDTTAQEQWQQEDNLVTYQCQTCGGEIIADDTTAASTCPYCGNHVVIGKMVSGTLKPDLVIPFKVDKKAAVEGLKQHYQGKKLLPRVFLDENHIEEVKGVYVPVWLFDAKADANLRFHGYTQRHYRQGQYDCTETSHFAIHRMGNLRFAGVPVDGSEKMPDVMMESIEPFDLSEAVDFQSAYLAGYFADRYDVDADQSIDRANQRIRASVEEAFLSTISGFMNVVPQHSSIRIGSGRVRYALYPVWLLTTNWNGGRYKFIMNGQTGKMAGDLPIDKGLQRKYFWQTMGIVGAAAFAVQVLLGLLM